MIGRREQERNARILPCSTAFSNLRRDCRTESEWSAYLFQSARELCLAYRAILSPVQRRTHRHSRKRRLERYSGANAARLAWLAVLSFSTKREWLSGNHTDAGIDVHYRPVLQNHVSMSKTEQSVSPVSLACKRKCTPVRCVQIKQKDEFAVGLFCMARETVNSCKS